MELYFFPLEVFQYTVWVQTTMNKVRSRSQSLHNCSYFVSKTFTSIFKVNGRSRFASMPVCHASYCLWMKITLVKTCRYSSTINRSSILQNVMLGLSQNVSKWDASSSKDIWMVFFVPNTLVRALTSLEKIYSIYHIRTMRIFWAFGANLFS